MSFLELIHDKRSKLRPIATTMTKVTGQRCVEVKTGDTKSLDKKAFGFVAERKLDESTVVIFLNFLYLGGVDAVNETNLKNLKIPHLLGFGLEAPIIASRTIEVKFIAFLDHPNTDLYKYAVSPALDFIEKARRAEGRVLVYSMAGVSRSPSVVIAYLMEKKGMAFDEAYKLVKSKRNCILPNDGFLMQLKSKKS